VTKSWNYGKDYGSDQVRKEFKVALEAGITLWTPLRIYGFGLSEDLLGQFMQQNNDQCRLRPNLVLLPGDLQPSLSRCLNREPETLTKGASSHQVHWPFSFFMSQQTLMNALADEVKRGRIEAVGVSNYSADQMRSPPAVG